MGWLFVFVEIKGGRIAVSKGINILGGVRIHGGRCRDSIADLHGCQ